MDIHDVLMTWNTDETSIVQRLCDKLASTVPSVLVWGGIFDRDERLKVSGVAGIEAPRLRESSFDYAEHIASVPGLKECVERLVPSTLAAGLIELNSRLFDALPHEVLGLPMDFYPLTSGSRCLGILAVSRVQKRKDFGHELLQLAAQHAGFALSMLREFVAKDHAQNELRLAAAVFDHSLEGIFITDINGNILAANAAVTRITGFSQDELIGQNPRMLKSGQHGQDFYTALWSSVHQHGQWEGEIWNRRKNGEVFPEWLSISAIRNESKQIQNYVGIFIDISKQKEAESRLHYLAYHDKLTGLPNRDLFHDRLNKSIYRAKRNQVEIAVLFIDIDHFKYINDTFGHTKGDMLLQKVTNRLRASLRENDTLARMGGDEFTVIIEDFSSQDDVEITAKRILDNFNAPIFLDNQELYVSVSIGISFFPEDANSPGMLMKHADTAMYSAKNNGRKRLHFFRSTMENYSIQRIEMERQLRHALDNHEFRVFYQPQLDIVSSKVIGAEALIRWRHPERGLVPPAEFIPLAEDTGMILPIGEWVLKQAWNECQGWHRAGYPLRIGVNLSAHQFNHTNLSELAELALRESGISPEYLELELTESLAMRQVDETLVVLKQLKSSGVKLSIDDFGTGYSSLSYLKQFPIDRLKIDKSFIHDIATDPNNAAIVVAIIAMAHCMGLAVIAEGVETEEQLRFLAMHGCNEVQGYLLSRPLPADEFLALLRNPSQFEPFVNTKQRALDIRTPVA